MRLAVFTFVARMLTWLFGAPYVHAPEEMNLFIGNLAYALFDSAELWVLYIALEPALRRLWPEGIVSWVRVLNGRLMDPLVGRDVLIGTLLGVVGFLLAPLTILATPWLGLPVPIPAAPTDLLGLCGTRYLVSLVFWTPIGALEGGLSFVIFLLVFRILLRRRGLAIAALAVSMLVVIDVPGTGPPVSFLFVAPIIAIGLMVLFRFGVFAWVIGCFSTILLSSVPLTLDLSAWYGTGTGLASLVLIAMAVYGLWVSLRARAGVPSSTALS
jgi:hypothetical protein